MFLLVHCSGSRLTNPGGYHLLPHAEFGDELSNSRSHDDENSAQKTVLISGIGDGAFYSADGPAIGLTGFRASYVISIGLVGSGAAAVPQERLRSLLQTALSHS